MAKEDCIAMKTKTLWLLGQYRYGECPNCVWDFQGIFDTKKQAISAAGKGGNPSYFIAPVKLNVLLGDDPVPFDGCFWPNAPTDSTNNH
jgi:hypothetical protein